MEMKGRFQFDLLVFFLLKSLKREYFEVNKEKKKRCIYKENEIS